ncbi:hypothetical protein [uncultured Gordonia sp.]|nr:hypothetical protein [uncultured Gordonia sp.]
MPHSSDHRVGASTTSETSTVPASSASAAPNRRNPLHRARRAPILE